jgi:UDP-N-acetylmuramoyl-L-alanyl-D-glutamate--2,6-diaminopimelate ligase
MAVRLGDVVDRSWLPDLEVVSPPDMTEVESREIEVTDVVIDSRHVIPGALFCCLRGARADGHDFAPAAVRGGAVALAAEHQLGLAVPVVLTRDVRSTVGHLAAAFHDHPSRAMQVVAVTGTNGKTTTVELVRAVFEQSGTRCGVIGTLASHGAGSPPTTPDAPQLQELLAGERARGSGAVAMEVSSHALAQGRVNGTHFAAAIFTNLGRDHLDFHGTMDGYFEAKASLLTPAFCDVAVVNLDDEYGRRLAERAAIRTVGYSLEDASDLLVTRSGSTFVWRDVRVELRLAGAFNVSNALGAATALAELGIPTDAIATGLGAVERVRGRWEIVDRGQPFTVVVDYAHTPDALTAALDVARRITQGRVIVVFGAGGDKDREKRPEMGRVAAEAADHVVLTSDNPRSEDPLEIIAAVRAGMPSTASLTVEPDRREAIRAALAAARTNDIVVLAGKGHETYQEIGDERLPFDDRAVVSEILESVGW